MRAIIWCALGCLVVAGCAPDQSESDRPTSSAPTSPPPVTRTLDPSAYATEQSVCGLLTDDQALGLGLQPTSKPHRTSDSALECQLMRQGSDEWQVEYDLFLNVDVLGSWYGSEDDLQLREIGGQPAGVLEQVDGGTCKVAVRLAEQKSLHVLVPDLDGKDACALAIPLAEQIVQNLAGEG